MKQEKSKGYALHNEGGRMSDRLNDRLKLNLLGLWTGVMILFLLGMAWKVGLLEVDVETSVFSAIITILMAIILIALAVLLGFVSKALLEALVTRVVRKKLKRILRAKPVAAEQSRSTILQRRFAKYVDNSEKEFLELCELNMATFVALLSSLTLLSSFAAERLGFYFLEVLVVGILSIVIVAVCVQDAIVLAFEDVRQKLLKKDAQCKNGGDN